SLTCGQTGEYAWGRLRDLFAALLDHAQAAGSVFCLEPLSPAETDFLNTVGEAQRMVRELDHPALRVHLDVKAMASEAQPIGDVIRQVTADEVGHVHVNDANLYGPGMGEVDYAPIAAALDAIGWDRWLSVEVFKYDPDPETIARQSIEYLRRFWKA
ncbi:MAG TPA: sugar phosphate isomerase/epimerase family protein, partial [Candidatus Sumerlaeota bacterium]|nr:sugar phosphate isomerase/epimerase family protein [Candidatus Sumerlaeota bacterium]